MQLTLASHYESKSPELRDFIKVLQDTATDHLLDGFQPYEIKQVHGTVVGLEGYQSGEVLRNKNFKDHRGQACTMDWSGLLEYFRSPEFPVINLHIGRFQPGEDYGFKSRDKHPYLRSVSIQEKIMVAMGWPYDGVYSNALDELRRSFQKFGILHKWHKTPEAIDNDFYFVLGRIDPLKCANQDLAHVQKQLRSIMTGLEIQFELSSETLSIVSYRDPQLPLGTSRARSVLDTDFDAAAAIAEYNNPG